jgi:hypothetical protein
MTVEDSILKKLGEHARDDLDRSELPGATSAFDLSFANRVLERLLEHDEGGRASGSGSNDTHEVGESSEDASVNKKAERRPKFIFESARLPAGRSARSVHWAAAVAVAACAGLVVFGMRTRLEQPSTGSSERDLAPSPPLPSGVATVPTLEVGPLASPRLLAETTAPQGLPQPAAPVEIHTDEPRVVAFGTREPRVEASAKAAARGDSVTPKPRQAPMLNGMPPNTATDSNATKAVSTVGAPGSDVSDGVSPRPAMTSGLPPVQALVARPAPGQRAESSEAQGLFDEGRKLMLVGDYEKACVKLENSRIMDPAIGTLLNLANCYEKQGRLASAWTRYLEAQRMARGADLQNPERVAQDRAARLALRLARLVIEVEHPAATPGLEILRDGRIIDISQWGVAIPSDPGTHTVNAIAPGKKNWATTADLSAEAVTVTIRVPVLESEVLEHGPTDAAARYGGTSIVDAPR